MATTTNFGWETPDDTDLVKDGAAAMRTLGNSIDTSFVDLKGGTTGQILSKASNTDLDYTWITNDIGDITAVTASSPLTGGGTSGAITVGIQDATTSVKGAVQLTDSTSSTSTTTAATPNSVKTAFDLADGAVAKSIVDAKGDLIAATAADTVSRLAVGANNTVLTADSSTATGLKWATPASSGGWTQITTGNLSGTETVVSITTTGYKQVVIFLKDVVCTTDWYWQLRINGDSNANYSTTELVSTGASSANAYSQGGVTNYSQQPIEASDYNCFGQWTIYDPANTNTVKQVVGNFSHVDNNATFRRNCMLTGQWFGTPAAVTSVTFIPASTFSSGTYEIYGVK